MPAIQNVYPPSNENVMTQSAEGVNNIMQQQIIPPPSVQPNQPASSSLADSNVPSQYSQTPVLSEFSSPPNSTASSESREKNNMNLQTAKYAGKFFLFNFIDYYLLFL